MSRLEPKAFMTLDQFRQMASRFQTKIDFIKHMLEKYEHTDESFKDNLVRDVLALLDAPADSFLSQEDMHHPLAPHCEQLQIFDKELC